MKNTALTTKDEALKRENMDDLITVNFEAQTVSARKLHKVLEIKKRFSEWFETNSQGFVEGEDFTSVLSGTVVNNGAHRDLQDYDMTVDMAKHLCLMSKTEKGKQCRQYLIELEKAWNTPEQVMARALKLADKTIAKLTATNKELEQKIEQDKPKTIFADAVSASDSSMLVRDLAKIIRQNGKSIGEKRLYKWMRENGYICKGTTTPTQKAMELGLFEIVVRTVERGDKLPIETKTTKVTGKGQQYFINKFLNKDERSA
jgi:anti-repressor protein